MKKFILLFALMTLPIASVARYIGPSDRSVISVAEAKKMRDDAGVILEGRIEKHIRKDKYLFNDGRDSIIVEIDEDEWMGLAVSEIDKVRVYGEIDAEWLRANEVQVEKIELVR